MNKPSAMICFECQEPIASGEEVVLSEEEMKAPIEPGKARAGLFKHRDEDACKRSTGSSSPPGR